MDEDEALNMLLDCDDIVVLGTNKKGLILWFSADTDEMKVLDMLLEAYHNFYKTAEEPPLH